MRITLSLGRTFRCRMALRQAVLRMQPTARQRRLTATANPARRTQALVIFIPAWIAPLQRPLRFNQHKPPHIIKSY
ncbi:hypothetical protein [Methylomonas methanica]|uniref:hypothetical protein n=1 Tax=Methylomonas methanica TaxID=421 RepID=UPI0002E732DF|nr:hypothetical protein [Methylomonas methanica]